MDEEFKEFWNKYLESLNADALKAVINLYDKIIAKCKAKLERAKDDLATAGEQKQMAIEALEKRGYVGEADI